MTIIRNDLYGNEISFPYHVNKYREKYGNDMNSFRNESHSGIVLIAPKAAQTASSRTENI